MERSAIPFSTGINVKENQDNLMLPEHVILQIVNTLGIENGN